MADGFERHDVGQTLQLGEICSFYGVQVVGGSNPLAPTKEIKASQATLVRPFLFGADFTPHVCPHTMEGSRGNTAEFSAGLARVRCAVWAISLARLPVWRYTRGNRSAVAGHLRKIARST